ncbi:MAG: segregation/condensation protein A [Bryobacteraceae bacterium]|nr:segregation/condensation protein A [Bryobacteraceae bacterium]
MSSPLNVQLEQYEGPLDLLLDLIRKQEIDIYDIPIAKITAQYLAYMEQAAEMNIELGAEFVYMAATLIHIKSKMLLPKDPALVEAGVEEDDPRSELVQRLLEHERFKNAAEMLHQKRLIEEAVWSNPQVGEFLSEDDVPDLAVTLFDLVKTFQAVLERSKSRPLYEVNQEEVTVHDMIQFLRTRLSALPADGKISVTELFERQNTRRAMICLFLAILEMVRMQALGVLQRDSFGEIHIRKHSGFERAFASNDAMAAIEQGYS